MRIIVWGINYEPELTGIAPFNTALCEFLSARGHEVEMLTAFPYYPQWEKRRGDCWRLFRTDVLRGVKVRRCHLHVPRKVTPLRRMLHEASFVASSLLRAVTLRAPDVYVVVSPPLLLGVAARIAGALKGAPFVFHVQDLQPDTAVGLGMLRKSRLTRALYRIEASAYRHAALVSGISRGMLDALAQKDVPPGKLALFPNGAVLPKADRMPVPGAFRRRHGFTDGEFLAAYSGNLGVKQGLDLLVEAAEILADKNIRVIVSGDGAERGRLAEQIRRKNLGNILMLPLQEPAAFCEMLVDADLCLVVQRAGTGRLFFPSKLLNIFAFGKPALTVSDTDSELARTVVGENVGVNVAPGDPGALARTMEKLAGNRDWLAVFGKSGRRYVERFDMEKVLADFENVLVGVVKGRGSR